MRYSISARIRMIPAVTVIALLLVLWSCSVVGAVEPRVVRVGAFNYYPGIFRDTDGVVKGFYVDALADIAEREGIRFEYVYGSWNEGLERIKNGEVDVLTSVAFTPERALFLDYATTPLLTVWGELYAPLASEIEGIHEVQGKRVAVMKGDFNARYFIDLVKKFGITCEFVEMAGFDDVFRAVAAKQVDAGVVNSTFGVAKQREYGLRSTGVVFNPFDIFFAVAKGHNQGLLALLESNLAAWRHQVDSPYNKARQKWSHGSTGVMHVIPGWLIQVASVLAVLVVVAALFIVLLRRQVRRATAEILRSKDVLRESEARRTALYERFRAIMDSLDALVYVSDMENHTLLMVNEYGKKIFGDVEGRICWQALQSGQTGPCDFCTNDRLLQADGVPVEVYVWEVQNTVTGRWYQCRDRAIRWHDNRLVRLEIATDITERKQAEKGLRESEARYRRITEGLTDYQYTVRVENGRAVETRQSPSCMAVTGYTPEEFIVDPYLWITMVLPEERQQVREQVQKILAGTDVAPIEHRITRKNGEIRWIRDMTILSKNDSGELVSYDGVIKDVTERKESQEKIRMSELKYRQLFQSMQNGFALHEVICDGQGVPCDYRFIEVNREFERLTGLNMEHVVGRTVLEVLPGTEPFWIETYGKVALSGESTYFEQYSAEIKRYFEVMVYSPQPRLFATIISDITSRKLAEQALQDKNAELERFTYTVSHDLKSPLITIQAYAGMIATDLEAGNHARAQGDLRRIESAASMMTALLNDLLELSRIGRQMNPIARIDMNRLVKDVLLQLTGPLDRQEIEVVIHPDLPAIQGDRKRIAEVVQNLVENAVKYRGDQVAPRIEIGTRQDGNECVFFVSDNGKGIEPRFHENIFGLFNKLDAGSDGTGVGLALVKRIIEVHGGRVWVESDGAGRGSTFCFTLPVKDIN